MSAPKVNVYNVDFFVQKGMACGGLNETLPIIAKTEQEAITKAKAEAMKNRDGKFVLVSVTKTGAQG